MPENTRRSKRAVVGVAMVGTAPAIATGYSHTRATRTNGITSSAQYRQFNLSEYYTLSRRTGRYALQAFQRANGKTLVPTGSGTRIINATATIGDGFQTTPSSSRSMVAVGAGVIHRF